MPGQVYALDTNVLAEAARRYYAFDIAPVFWSSLMQCASDGRVLSIDPVHDEIRQYKDELRDWAKQHFAPWFMSTDDDDVVAHYADVAKWVQAQDQFTDAARAAFLDGADGWLVASALAGSYVVVTQEVEDLRARKRVPIPNVCRAFGVACSDTFQMLRELGVCWT